MTVTKALLRKQLGSSLKPCVVMLLLCEVHLTFGDRYTPESKYGRGESGSDERHILEDVGWGFFLRQERPQPPRNPKSNCYNDSQTERNLKEATTFGLLQERTKKFAHPLRRVYPSKKESSSLSDLGSLCDLCNQLCGGAAQLGILFRRDELAREPALVPSTL